MSTPLFAGSPFGINTCKCGADLTVKSAVQRTYISKSPDKYPDSYAEGHYNALGDFEPDRSPSYPLEHHDLVDGSDTCVACDAVVG